MKLSVINENREPESVAPKIKVFDTEKDLDAALPDLKDGAIVATKEDVSADAPDMSIIDQLAKKSVIYSWDVLRSLDSGEKMYLTKDFSTRDSINYWMIVITNAHTSYGNNTNLRMDILKLNYTPYNDTDYRGVQTHFQTGQGGINASFGWDEGGIYATFSSVYRLTYRCTVIMGRDVRPE